MKQKRVVLFLLILTLALPMAMFSQEIINPMTSKEKSADILEYIQITNNKYASPKNRIQLFKSQGTDFKKLLSLAIFSRLNDTAEYNKLRMDKSFPDRRRKFTGMESKLSDLFFEPKLYRDFEFKYKKYLLRDLYRAPLVFCGTITKLDTICNFLGRPISRVQISNITKFNKYYATNVDDKKMEFIYSPFHSMTGNNSWLINPEEEFPDQFEDVFNYKRFHYLEVGKRYLVYLSALPTDDSDCFLEMPNKPLPYLYVTTKGTECFPIEGNKIIDVNRYFGKKRNIDLDEVKNMLDLVLDEIANWR